MTSREKVDKIFCDHFKISKEELSGLTYRSFKKWDSMAHMELMSILEETFDIMMETIDILSFSTYEKGLDILRKYGVDL